MSAESSKKGTKIIAWILIGAMLISFVFAIVVVIVQQISLAGIE